MPSPLKYILAILVKALILPASRAFSYHLNASELSSFVPLPI